TPNSSIARMSATATRRSNTSFFSSGSIERKTNRSSWPCPVEARGSLPRARPHPRVLPPGIERADAEQVELVRAERGAGLLAEQPVETGLAAQKRRRHAVHVTGLRGLRRVV